jgi:Ca2+-binding RTX toxin-like protein
MDVLAGLVSNLFRRDPYAGEALLPWPAGPASRPSTVATALPGRLAPLGTHTFGIRDSPVEVGRTGVMVRVSDLAIPESQRRVFAGGRAYQLPGSVSQASAAVTGTELPDRIRVFQNPAGDTVVRAWQQGEESDLNLGRIAALTLSGLGGDDTIAVEVANYFGGVRVSGGAGDDTIAVSAQDALARGVTLEGEAGDDAITLSGQMLAAWLHGGSGRDLLDIGRLVPDSGLTRNLEGGNDSDILLGSAGRDRLQGGAGNDVLHGHDGDDDLDGGEGEDALYGGAGDDRLEGGPGHDLLDGGPGHDALAGGAGDDVLQAGPGHDVLRGGIGNDFLYAGDGHDLMFGNEGRDNFAPLANRLEDIYAYDQVASFLKVMVRGEERRQARVASLSAYVRLQKTLADYDANEDYLVDVNELA